MITVRVIKRATDPKRPVIVNLGGWLGPNGSREVTGYYCVYRGAKEAAIQALQAALAALRQLPPGEPPVRPEEPVKARTAQR